MSADLNPNHNTSHKPSSFLPWSMSTDLHLTTTQATNLLHSYPEACQQIFTLPQHKPQTFFILTLKHVNRSSPYHNTCHKPPSFLPWSMSTDLHLTTTQATNLLHSYPEARQQIFTLPQHKPQTFFILTLKHVNRSSPYHNTSHKPPSFLPWSMSTDLHLNHNTSHKPSSFLPWSMSTDLHLTTTQATNLLHSYPEACQQIFTLPQLKPQTSFILTLKHDNRSSPYHITITYDTNLLHSDYDVCQQIITLTITHNKPPSFLLQCMLTDLCTNRNTSQTFFILTMMYVNRS